jgi:hypothetical protein
VEARAAPTARRLKGGLDLVGFVLPAIFHGSPGPDGPLRLVGDSSDLAAAGDAGSRLTDKIANVT